MEWMSTSVFIEDLGNIKDQKQDETRYIIEYSKAKLARYVRIMLTESL